MILMLLVALLQGCVNATYNATEGAEYLEIKTLFKSVDGFQAYRGKDFKIKIDKTHSNDPTETMAQMLQMMQMMQAMMAGPPVPGDSP